MIKHAWIDAQIVDAVTDGIRSSEVNTFFADLELEARASVQHMLDTHIREWVSAHWPKLVASIVDRISYSIELSDDLHAEMEVYGSELADVVVDKLIEEFDSDLQESQPTLVLQDILDDLEKSFETFITGEGQ